MRAALIESMLATDLADYWWARGVPFRQAHGLAGRVVRLSESKNVPLSQLTLEDYLTISSVFESDVQNCL